MFAMNKAFFALALLGLAVSFGSISAEARQRGGHCKANADIVLINGVERCQPRSVSAVRPARPVAAVRRLPQAEPRRAVAPVDSDLSAYDQKQYEGFRSACDEQGAKRAARGLSGNPELTGNGPAEIGRCIVHGGVTSSGAI